MRHINILTDMKHLILIICMLATLSANAQYAPYSGSLEQKAAKLAFNLIKTYYPGKTVCVSDSIYDLDWAPYYTDIERRYRNDVPLHNDNRQLINTIPVYSKNLHNLFGDECDSGFQSDYIVAFSSPCKGMFRCDVFPRVPSRRKLSFTVISTFLFQFQEEIIIYRMVERECFMLYSMEECNKKDSKSTIRVGVGLLMGTSCPYL